MFIKRILLVIVILIMAFYGLRTEKALKNNSYSLLAENMGIGFAPYSMAYTESFPHSEDSDHKHLSIEMLIKPDFPKPKRFGLILQIYDNSNDSQISVGQWDKSLVILNSDDYSNSKRLPKIYAPLESAESPLSISIESGSRGTSVSINGKLIKQNPSLFLEAPDSGEKSQLIVGNGIFGATPWEGSISSLAIFYSDSGGPLLSYDFSERKDNYILEQSGLKFPLILPNDVKPLKKGILRFPRLSTLRSGSMEIDMLFNFIGFIPLGFLFFLNMPKTRRNSHFLPLLIAISGCFLFSLSIEIIQIWLPGRDSSTLDLILNTMGGLVGSLAAFTARVLLS